MIHIKNLNLHIDKTHVLKNVNLDVKKGEAISIIGPSGSGKSSFLRCLNLLERPQHGTIDLGGENILRPDYDILKLRQRVGMIFQHFNLFPHLKVLRNVAFAPEKVLGKPREEAEDLAMQLLRRVGLSDHAQKHPQQLSGGQKQRVAIARALAMSPEVLLLDEPTSALDPEMVKEVLDVIAGLKDEGITLLAVSHEMAFAKTVANRLIFMDEGQIIEDTTPTAFYKSPVSARGKSFLTKIVY